MEAHNVGRLNALIRTASKSSMYKSFTRLGDRVNAVGRDGIKLTRKVIQHPASIIKFNDGSAGEDVVAKQGAYLIYFNNPIFIESVGRKNSDDLCSVHLNPYIFYSHLEDDHQSQSAAMDLIVSRIGLRVLPSELSLFKWFLDQSFIFQDSKFYGLKYKIHEFKLGYLSESFRAFEFNALISKKVLMLIRDLGKKIKIRTTTDVIVSDAYLDILGEAQSQIEFLLKLEDNLPLEDFLSILMRMLMAARKSSKAGVKTLLRVVIMGPATKRHMTCPRKSLCFRIEPLDEMGFTDAKAIAASNILAKDTEFYRNNKTYAPVEDNGLRLDWSRSIKHKDLPRIVQNSIFQHGSALRLRCVRVI